MNSDFQRDAGKCLESFVNVCFGWYTVVSTHCQRDRIARHLFPFRITYSIDINSMEDEKVLLRTEEWLRTNKIHDFYRKANKIVFRISFFGWSWDKFGAFDSGRFIAENSRLTFVASMYRMSIFVTILCGCVAYEAGWTTGIFFFIFLFFGNYFTGHYQVKRAFDELTSR
jgi:hypothetical protein